MKEPGKNRWLRVWSFTGSLILFRNHRFRVQTGSLTAREPPNLDPYTQTLTHRFFLWKPENNHGLQFASILYIMTASFSSFKTPIWNWNLKVRWNQILVFCTKVNPIYRSKTKLIIFNLRSQKSLISILTEKNSISISISREKVFNS
jgi:hypothetical protein